MTSRTVDSQQHRSSSRRALKVAVIVFASAIVVILLALFLRPSWIANALKHQVEQVTSKSLSRPVTIGAIKAQWLPLPGATLEQFRIEGEAGEPPILEAQKASATVKLWPLIRSLGQDVQVDTVDLVHTTLNLVRRKDGTWNYEEIKSSGDSKREVSLGRLSIVDGELHVQDEQAAVGGATVALRDIDLDLRNITPGEAMTIKGKAALTSSKQNVDVDLKIDPLPANPNDKPSLSGKFAMRDLKAQAFRSFMPAKATAYFTGGLLDLTANISTDANKHYAVSGKLNADQLKLRGEPANGSLSFATTVNPDQPKAAKIALTNIAMKGPGLELGGQATLSMQPMRADFALSGPLLDLDHLMAALPQTPEAEKAANEPLVPDSVRSELPDLAVHGSLDVGTVKSGKLQANAVKAQAQLTNGVLQIERGTANVYAGTVDLGGTEIDLKPQTPAWSLKAKVQAMDMGQAFASLSGQQVVQGRASGNLALSGQGNAWEQIRQHVTGAGLLEIADGTLTTADVGASIAPVVSSGLTALGKGGMAGTVEKVAKGTKLKDLRSGFTIRDGWLSFTKPVGFSSDFGGASLEGRVALDQRLDLHGQIAASPQFVKSITSGAIAPRAPVPVPLNIEGTLKQPSLKPGSAGQVATGLIKSAPLPAPVQQKEKELENEAKAKARKGLGDVFNRFGGGAPPQH